MSGNESTPQGTPLGGLDILESFADGLVVLDGSWRHTFVNSAAARLLNRTREQMLGRTPWEIFPEIDRDILIARLQTTIENKTVMHFENFRPLEGRWYEYRVYPFAAGVSLLFSDITAKKNAAEALGESEERFRRTFDQAGVGIAHFSPEGRWLRVNRAFCEMVDYSSAELLDANIRDITHPDDYEGNVQARDELLKGPRERYSTEKRYFRKDGSIVWVSQDVSLVRKRNGEPDYFISVVENIHERKSLQEKLRHTEEILRLAQQVAQAGVWHWNIITGETSFSDDYYRLMGVPPSAPLSYEEWFEIIEPQDREKCERVIAEGLGLDHKGELQLEFRIRHPEKGTRWLSSIGRTFFDLQGVPLYMSGITIDITAQRQSEQAAQAASQKLVNTLEFISDGFASLDREWRYTYINQAGTTFFGHTREEVLGHTPWELFPDFDAAPLREKLNEAVEKNTVVSFDNFYPPQGKWYECRIYPSSDGASLFFTDTTERKRVEQDAREARDAAESASRAKDQFLAVLSHELRTPLNPVLMTVTSLAEDRSLPPQVLDDLEMIRRNLELEARLIDDMLDLSRVINGKMKLDVKPTNVHALLRNVIEIFAGPLLDRRLQCRCELEAGDDQVAADPARLQQVFWNLLSNAIKFTPEGGGIVLRSWNDQAGRLFVEISDSGEGILPDFLPHIFDAFEQGEHNAGRKNGGLGLGLAITKAILDLHGGNIRAESAGKGLGAKFLIDLPTTGVAELVGRIAPGLQAPNPKNLRLLLVDDHPDTLKTLKRLLERKGFSVMTAGSVAAAMKLLGVHQFDVLVSDIGLPDGTGNDLMRQVKKRWKLPGIAVSGYGMDSDRNESRAAGFDDHITKPIDIDKLAASINRVCSEPTITTERAGT